MAQTLQLKKKMDKKKQRDETMRWEQIREADDSNMTEERRKVKFEERRHLVEENKMRQEIIAKENKLIMMDPNGMDEKARAYWEIQIEEILCSRMVSASGSGNGGDGH